MSGRSSPVQSAQEAPHPALESVLRRHQGAPYQRPIQDHNRRAFDALLERIERDPAPLVLDAGCGTGLSTARLAALHPEAWVIGVDRSAARLARQGAAEQLRQRGRVLWLRAELVDIYRLARRARLQLKAHYLLYPNPYPKPAQLRRRWQGHPVFFDLIALGGALSLRSNWWVYAKEWEQALSFMGLSPELTRLELQPQPLSPFEAKYQASGHALWQLRAAL